MPPPEPRPEFVYKVVPRPLWRQARDAGTFAGAPVDLADGYIHLSTASQLPGTLRRHFAGQPDLILLALRTEALGGSLRWEPSRGGDLFPHLYRAFAPADVAWSAGIAVAPDGACALPERVR